MIKKNVVGYDTPLYQLRVMLKLNQFKFKIIYSALRF